MLASLSVLSQSDPLGWYEIGWMIGICGIQCGRGNQGVIFHMS